MDGNDKRVGIARRIGPGTESNKGTLRERQCRLRDKQRDRQQLVLHPSWFPEVSLALESVCRYLFDNSLL